MLLIATNIARQDKHTKKHKGKRNKAQRISDFCQHITNYHCPENLWANKIDKWPSMWGALNSIQNCIQWKKASGRQWRALGIEKRCIVDLWMSLNVSECLTMYDWYPWYDLKCSTESYADGSSNNSKLSIIHCHKIRKMITVVLYTAMSMTPCGQTPDYSTTF